MLAVEQLITNEIVTGVIDIARTRKSLRGPFRERRAEAEQDIERIIQISPALASQRAIAYFSQDSHLEIAPDITVTPWNALVKTN